MSHKTRADKTNIIKIEARNRERKIGKELKKIEKHFSTKATAEMKKLNNIESMTTCMQH